MGIHSVSSHRQVGDGGWDEPHRPRCAPLRDREAIGRLRGLTERPAPRGLSDRADGCRTEALQEVGTRVPRRSGAVQSPGRIRQDHVCRAPKSSAAFLKGLDHRRTARPLPTTADGQAAESAREVSGFQGGWLIRPPCEAARRGHAAGDPGLRRGEALNGRTGCCAKHARWGWGCGEARASVLPPCACAAGGPAAAQTPPMCGVIVTWSNVSVGYLRRGLPKVSSRTNRNRNGRCIGGRQHPS